MSDEIHVFGSPVKLGVVPHEALNLVELAQQDENGAIVIRYLMPEDARRLRDRLEAALNELAGEASTSMDPGIPFYSRAADPSGIYSIERDGVTYAVKFSASGARPLFEGRRGHWWWSLPAAVEDRKRHGFA